MFAADCTGLEGGKADFVLARSFEAEKVVAQVGVIGDIAARHIGDGRALVLVNAHDRRCSPKTYRRGRLFIFHEDFITPMADSTLPAILSIIVIFACSCISL